MTYITRQGTHDSPYTLTATVYSRMSHMQLTGIILTLFEKQLFHDATGKVKLKIINFCNQVSHFSILKNSIALYWAANLNHLNN